VKTEERLAQGALPGAKPEEVEHYETLVVKATRLQPNPTLPRDAFVFAPPAGYRLVINWVGKPLPSLTLPDLQGRPVALERYRGKDLLLVFWASWNPYAVHQLLALQEFRTRHPGPGLVVLTATLDVAKADVQHQLQVNHVALPTLLAGGDLEARVAPLDVSSLPKLFFVGKDGVIRAVVAHPLDLAELEATARGAGFKL
jgi:hypothetical protein